MNFTIEEVTEEQFQTTGGMKIPADSYFCNGCWFEEDTDNLLGFSDIANDELKYFKIVRKETN